MRTTTKRTISTMGAAVLLLAACGSDSDGIESADEAAGADAQTTEADIDAIAEDVEESAEDVQESAEEFADEIADDLEEAQASAGGGGATLTANGQTWEFDSVLCAFGEEQIGQPGSVFNLSAIADGLQLYASIDDSGESHSLSLNDIDDFENPSVSLSADPFSVSLSGEPADFLVLDDTSVSSNVVMMDDTTGEPTAEPAQFSATCP